MRRIRGLTALAAVTLLPLLSAPGIANGNPIMNATPNLCRVPVDLTSSTTQAATVNRFDVGNHETEQPAYNRIVIGLDQPAASYRVRYVPQIIQDGSGLPVELQGNADLEVRIEGASAHNDDGQSTVPTRNYHRDWESLRQAKLVSDFEGMVVFGIGVSQPVDFRVFTLNSPHRLVIDLAMPEQHLPKCQNGAVKVFFLNEPRFVANTPPFFTPVWRRVATPAVAGGALSSMFHGPTEAEYQQGLRFLDSGASGFTGLSIDSGIARVRLTGDCDSGGSTVTIADEIMRTLRQFPSVQHVKILSPNGQTANPNGPGDSIPDCLNP